MEHIACARKAVLSHDLNGLAYCALFLAPHKAPSGSTSEIDKQPFGDRKKTFRNSSEVTEVGWSIFLGNLHRAETVHFHFQMVSLQRAQDALGKWMLIESLKYA